MEEMPTIAGFVLASVTRDLADFTDYSVIFNQDYLTDLDAKRKACTELIMTDSVNIALKAATTRLYEQLKNLRILLVRIEGYMNMAKTGLSGERLGIKKLRSHLDRKNVEGVVLNGRSFANNLTENKTVLMAKGLKQEQIDSLTTLLNTLESLNEEQNELMSKRAQNCLNNMGAFNNLWDVLLPVLQAGKALYKATNEAKLKDYTMTHLKKRMNNERKKAAAADTPADPGTGK